MPATTLRPPSVSPSPVYCAPGSIGSGTKCTGVDTALFSGLSAASGSPGSGPKTQPKSTPSNLFLFMIKFSYRAFQILFSVREMTILTVFADAHCGEVLAENCFVVQAHSALL